ncbi:MAG: ATP-binding protein [Ferruginibacter sp.]
MEISEIKTLLIVLTSLFLLMGLFVFAFFLIYRKNQNAKEIQIEKLKETLLQSQIEIQEQTLQHISRELHDNLGQVASLIKINLNTLQLNNIPKTTEKIEATKELTRQLIADIKSLSVSLGSDRIAQAGLVKALETEVDRLNKTGQFTALFALEGTMPLIDNDKAVILYRMAQEILNNMVKHSHATQINIFLHASENLFKLQFNDDGVGFNAAEKLNGSGAGLRNLTSRALLIHATLQILSSAENGTSIIIEMPL